MIVDMITNGTTVTNPKTGEEVHTQGNGWNLFMDIFRPEAKKISTGNAHLFEDVYACINVLSDDVAKLPIKQYLKDGRSVERVSDGTIAYILGKQPNEQMTPFVFKKLLMVDVLTSGNFYALIGFDKDGEVEQLHPLDSSVTRPATTQDGEFVFVTNQNGENVVLYNHEVIHIKGYSTDGIIGKSPIEAFRDSAESNRSATVYNKDMMVSGGLPKGVVEVVGNLNSETKKKFRKTWEAVNSNEAIAILDSGMTYKQMSMSNRDMEFIQSQKFNQQKISAIYKVPLHKINNLDHATYTNIEHQSLDYVKNTLQPWIVQIEEELNRKLYTKNKQTRGYYVKFNLDSELRGDAESRAKVQEIKLRNGLLTVNEGRGQDEFAPFESISTADDPLITLNYTPLERLIEYQYQGGVPLPVPEGVGEEETDDNEAKSNGAPVLRNIDVQRIALAITNQLKGGEKKI